MTESKFPWSPASLKVLFLALTCLGLVTNPTVVMLESTLFVPPTWSPNVNGPIYEFVAFVLQASKAHNLTIDGGAKYNVPSEEVTIDKATLEPFLNWAGGDSSQDLTSYTIAAISGADDFNDDNTTITDLFNSIVNNTREVSPTCKFSLFTCTIRSFHSPDLNQVGTIWDLGYVQEGALSGEILTIVSSGTLCMDGQSVPLSGFPHSTLPSSRTQFS